MSATKLDALTTQTAVEAVAWERAPRYTVSDFVNRRIVCADRFTVSVQASGRHYAEDSHPSGKALYWRFEDEKAGLPVHVVRGCMIGMFCAACVLGMIVAAIVYLDRHPDGGDES